MVVPQLIGVIIAVSILFFVFTQIGAFAVLGELTDRAMEYEGSLELQREYMSAGDYVMESGTYDTLVSLIRSPYTWTVLGSAWLLMLIVGWFTSTATFGMAAAASRGTRPGFRTATTAIKNKVLRYAGLRLMIMGLVLAPAAVLFGLALTGVMKNILLAVLILVAFTMLYAAWIIILTLRLVFSSPSLFLDDQGPIGAVKASYSLTKGAIGVSALVLVVLLGVGFVQGQLRGPAIEAAAWLFGGGVGAVVGGLGLTLLMVAIAALSAFDHAFLLFSYKEHARRD